MHHGWNKSTKPLILGLIFSLVMIFAAYEMTTHLHVKGSTLMVSLMALASLQALAQLIFFMHVGLESKPRWNLAMLILTIFVVVLIVWGSVWIMENLNRNLMVNMGGIFPPLF